MIAYDLDGVLCPEYDYGDATFEQRINTTQSFLPIFQPKGEYAIITGRIEQPFTLVWLITRLQTQPLVVFINTNKEKSYVFKARILNDLPEITHFVESNISEVEYLKQHTKQKIIHIDELLPM
jgi:hypothetical protein